MRFYLLLDRFSTENGLLKYHLITHVDYIAFTVVFSSKSFAKLVLSRL